MKKITLDEYRTKAVSEYEFWPILEARTTVRGKSFLEKHRDKTLEFLNRRDSCVPLEDLFEVEGGIPEVPFEDWEEEFENRERVTTGYIPRELPREVWRFWSDEDWKDQFRRDFGRKVVDHVPSKTLNC